MKKIILALVLSFCVTSAFAKDVWEHKVEKRGGLNYLNPGNLSDRLTQMGAQGWQLVSVQHLGKQSWYFYKRKK